MRINNFFDIYNINLWLFIISTKNIRWFQTRLRPKSVAGYFNAIESLRYQIVKIIYSLLEKYLTIHHGGVMAQRKKRICLFRLVNYSKLWINSLLKMTESPTMNIYVSVNLDHVIDKYPRQTFQNDFIKWNSLCWSRLYTIYLWIVWLARLDLKTNKRSKF